MIQQAAGYNATSNTELIRSEQAEKGAVTAGRGEGSVGVEECASIAARS